MSKPFLLLTLILITIASCKQKEAEPTDEATNTEASATDTLTDVMMQVEPESATTTLDIDAIFGDNTLISMEVNSDSKDPLVKYGLEFSGNCYACDAAQIRFTKQNVFLENTTHSVDDVVNYQIKKVEIDGNQTIIKTDKVIFIFDRIENLTLYKRDEATIFRLRVEGQMEENQNLRLVYYYTTLKALPNFDTCDCGEFQG